MEIAESKSHSWAEWRKVKLISDIQVHFLSSEISPTVSFLLRIPIRVAQSWFVRDLFTWHQEPSIVVVVMLVIVPVGSSAHR